MIISLSGRWTLSAKDAAKIVIKLDDEDMKKILEREMVRTNIMALELSVQYEGKK